MNVGESPYTTIERREERDADRAARREVEGRRMEALIREIRAQREQGGVSQHAHNRGGS